MDWKRPSEELPECEVGDRVVGIVLWREHANLPLRPHVIVLTATETGWESEGGYSLDDCEWWMREREFLEEVVG